MLIRTRLLLLALLPVPVLLALGVVVLRAEQDRLREADAVVQLVQAVASAHAVASAVYAERDAAASAVSRESLGLEALLLGDIDQPAAAPDADTLAQRQRATDDAAAQFADSTGSRGGERLREAVGRVTSAMQTLRADGADADSVTTTVRRYGETARTLSDFADIAATAADDAGWARSLRTLAVLERIENALALERLYVRHTVVTRALDPAVARELSASEGRLENERHLALEVFDDGFIGRRLRASLAQAEQAGRDRLLAGLRGFAERLDILNLLYQAVGYGGLIHDFKNYVLRDEPAFRAGTEARAVAARGLIDELAQPGMLASAELEDLALVRNTVDIYVARLAEIDRLRARGLRAAEIDLAVRYDDDPTLAALTRLSAFRSDISPADWDRLMDQLTLGIEAARADVAVRLRDAAMQTAQARRVRYGISVAAIALTLLVLAGLAGFTYRRMSRGIRVLVGEFERVARSGDVAPRQLVSGSDELAQLNTAVVAIGQRLGQLAAEAEQMAEGDFSGEIQPLGPEDRLALAMRAVSQSARDVVTQAQAISAGNYETTVQPRSERDALSHALVDMAGALRQFRGEVVKTQWLNNRRVQVLEALRASDRTDKLAEHVLATLLDTTEAPLGVFHVRSRDGFSAAAQRGARNDAETGALVTRALDAEQTVLLTPLPPGYLRLDSGLGAAELPALTLTPLRARGEVVGVVELGWLEKPDDRVVELLDSVAESIGIALTAANARLRTEALLTETRQLADKLQEQQVELRQSNEELEEQTQLLRQSEEELKSQREELQSTNEELEEKGELLERQRRQVEQNARDLAQATRYKSEFLANMSHELRTPLNSLLILSKQLAANEEGNLDEDQVQAARIIYEGGRDLLMLINDILDLSKVEAGKLDVHFERCDIAGLLSDLQRIFEPQAKDKGIALSTEIADGIPAALVTDRQRLAQILRNLLSNAIKFTAQGEVRLAVSRPAAAARPAALAGRDDLLAFAVTDSGIGIAEDALEGIFEAFRQADGSTGRKYGGTGLGLAIARQLAALMGGEVAVQSEVGRGSTFTVFLPETAPISGAATLGTAAPSPAAPARAASSKPETATPEDDVPLIDDDRAVLKPGDRSILVIEDDPAFARILLGVIRKRGFRCLVAGRGRAGLRLAKQYRPSAIVLDLGLPDIDGMTVLETLKGAGETRHIPVHIVSASDPSTEPLRRGALGFIHKPAEIDELGEVLGRIESLIDRPQRTVLVVEDDSHSQHAVRSLLQNEQTRVLTAGSGAEAMATLREQNVDCIVLDLSLPDTDGTAFLKELRAAEGLDHAPVVVYTGRDLDADEHRLLSELAQSIVIKGAASPERLLDEVVLFLHAVEAELPEAQRRIVTRLHSGADAFAGRKLLLVDDDLRNTFALSGALKKRGLDVVIADNGQMALERLAQHPDVDAVLMDVMMPVMDGLEATQKIREDARFKDLPIITLTARAMAEDRRKCLEAGASDYLSKPVDMDQLLAMLRVWFGRQS